MNAKAEDREIGKTGRSPKLRDEELPSLLEVMRQKKAIGLPLASELREEVGDRFIPIVIS